MSLSHMPARSEQNGLLLRLGGVGAVCALMVFVLGMGWGFLSPDEPTSELFLLLTPVVASLALIPTLGAVYAIYRHSAPRLSRVMLSFGNVGILAITLLPMLYLFHIPTNPMRGHPLLLVCLGLLVANGIWPIIAGGMELAHPTPRFAGMGIAGILAGGMVAIFFLCVMTFSWTFLGTGYILVLLLPVLVITQCVWLAGMGYRLLIDP